MDFKVNCLEPFIKGVCGPPSSVISGSSTVCSAVLGPVVTTGTRNTVATISIPSYYLDMDGANIKIEIGVSAQGGIATTRRGIFATISNGFSNAVLLGDLTSFSNGASPNSSFSFELNLLRRDASTFVSRLLGGSVIGGVESGSGAVLVYTGGNLSTNLDIGLDLESTVAGGGMPEGTVTLESFRVCTTY
jgi:hypothetical protein